MNRQSGFTLIETIVYIALFMIVIGGGLTAAYGVIEGSDKTSSRSIVEQEGTFVLRKLNWAMTGATSASVPSATHLAITRVGTTVDFTFDGTAIELESSPLTSLNVKISSISYVETLATASRPKSIKASFWLTGTRGGSQYFETTKYLR